MVPALIIVRVLNLMGATDLLAAALAPLMSVIGLPAEFGLVWAAAMLTNLYTSMVVFYDLAAASSYTSAQMSTLGVLVLLAHALPIEGAVAKLLGVPWRFTLLLRIGCAYLLAWCCFLGYEYSGSGKQAVTLLWQPEALALTWLDWGLEQLQVLGTVLLILASLMALLRVLRVLGVEAILGVLLRPLMQLMTVSQRAGNVTIVGLLLGLSFGAGLLIDESRRGSISRRDMKVVACFLGLCHSVIEDTLLILLLGADLLPILFGRFLFACLVIAYLARRVLRNETDTS